MARCSRILLIALLLAIAGCAFTDPYAFEQEGVVDLNTQPNPMTRAVMGLPDKTGFVPLTGPMGGGGGAMADQYMQQQETALKQELKDSGVRVVRKGGEIRLVMPGRITFASDSAQLDESFLPVLDAVSRVLMHFDQTRLEINGHTDSKGRQDYNQELSQRRAEAVMHFLLNAGVMESRVRSIGWGEKKPIATNKTEAGRASNRRVELKIRSLDGDE